MKPKKYVEEMLVLEAKKHMLEYDTDGDGKMSKEEYDKQHAESEDPEEFNRVDTDKECSCVWLWCNSLLNSLPFKNDIA